MAKSVVEICNIALARIGVTMSIAALSEKSKEAIQCSLLYEQTRDRVLSAAPWPFARKFAALQLTGDAPDRWLYRYEYPNDCLDIRHVYPPLPSGMTASGFRLWQRQSRAAYELAEGEDDNQTLCTDVEQAVAEYTVRVVNPLRFTSQFSSALEWALAAELALPLAKGIDYAKNAAVKYEQEINETLAKSLNEEAPDVPADSEFVTVRY
jgi:hypothetical protein